jgi:hypothetical protein
MGAVAVTEQAIINEAHERGMVVPNRRERLTDEDTQAAYFLFHKQTKLFGGWNQMVRDSIQTWLNSLNLNLEQMVLAGLALQLASQFDSEANTSTAAELRKTVLEISRQVKGQQVEHDPLAELLTR